jgi:hypothetical protein
MVGGRVVAAAVPVALAGSVGITEHDGQAVADFGQGVSTTPEPRRVTPTGSPQRSPWDGLRIRDGQVNTQPVRCSAHSRGQPGQLVDGFRRRRGAHSDTPDVGAA